MEKKVVEKKVMKAISKAVGNKVKANADIWPPLCSGFLHQPKRPVHDKGKK